MDADADADADAEAGAYAAEAAGAGTRDAATRRRRRRRAAVGPMVRSGAALRSRALEKLVAGDEDGGLASRRREIWSVRLKGGSRGRLIGRLR